MPEVAVGLIVGDGGRLLLQHRDDKPGILAPGQWSLFGGHIDPDEPTSAAFLREMEEELGWRPRHFERYVVRDVDHGGLRVTSHTFAAHLDVRLDGLTLNEGQGLALFDPGALPEAIVPGLRPVVAEFVASDAYRRVKRAWDALSVTAILVDARGRFLLQHRDDKPDITNPGMWGSFGGVIEPFETPDEALIRELQEELDWTPASHALVDSGPYRGDGQMGLVYVYAAAVEVAEHDLTLGEGQGMAFFHADELPERTVPAYAELLHRFASSSVYAQLMRDAASAAA